jgi:hypothetical protein
MFLNPGETVPHRPTAWYAVGVVNFAQTSVGSERILLMQGRHGKCSTSRPTRTNLSATLAGASFQERRVLGLHEWQ